MYRQIELNNYLQCEKLHIWCNNCFILIFFQLSDGGISVVLKSECGATKFFNRTIQLRKEAKDPDIVHQSATAECMFCGYTLHLEEVYPMYYHLFEKHPRVFVRAMVWGPHEKKVFDMVEYDKMKYIEEEVKNVVFIQHNLMKPHDTVPTYVKNLIVKKLRDIFVNRFESCVFKNDVILNSFVDIVEDFVGLEIVF